MDDYNDEGLGIELREQGWLQGTLFKAPTTLVFCNQIFPTKDNDLQVTPLQKTLSNNEILVLITQDCDLVSTKEEYVEALVCYVESDRGRLGSWDRNSARYFVVNPEQNLVAQAYMRIILSKESLKYLEPIDWAASEDRFTRFKTWLTRRYNRPAIEDEIVDLFNKPVAIALQEHFKKHKNIGLDFTKAVHEIKINLPTTSEPPYDLRLVLIVKRDNISKEEIEAIDEVLEVIKNSVDQAKIIFDEDLIANETEISVAEYRQAVPLYLEYYTYKGENIRGIPQFDVR